MLVTDKNKILLHMPRCGGSSARWGLMKSGIRHRYSCEHMNHEMIPEIYQGYDRVAFIRNPIRWYESYYSHAKKFFDRNGHNGAGVLVRVLSENFKTPYEEFLNNSLDMQHYFSDESNLNRLRRNTTMSIMNHHICCLTTYWEDLEAITAQDFDKTMFSWYHDMVGIQTAKVFKLEDGLEIGLKEFVDEPVILHKNSACRPDDKIFRTEDISNIIYEKDYKYFEQYKYEKVI